MNVTRSIDGKDVEFRRMRADEVVALLDAAYEWHRAALVAQREDYADIDAALDRLLAQRGDLTLLWRFARAPAGSLVVLKKSAPEGFSLDSMDRYDMAALALELCGFRLAEDGGEGQEARPIASGSG